MPSGPHINRPHLWIPNTAGHWMPYPVTPCGPTNWRPRTTELPGSWKSPATLFAHGAIWRSWTNPATSTEHRSTARSTHRDPVRSRDSAVGFWLHESAMYLEGQTEFRDILWARQRPAGVFLDSMQPVPDRVRVANKHAGRTAHRGISVLPDPKRFEKRLPVLVGKVGKAVQRRADRLDHHLRRAHGSGGQDGAVEHRDRGCGVGRAPQHHPCHMHGLWRIAQIPKDRTDSHPRSRRPRQ